MDTSAGAGQDRPYRPRLIDAALTDALRVAGAVVIEGARGVGKTMTAAHAARSTVYLDDPANQELALIAPDAVLGGPAPRLLDEWQVAPHLWNAVRRAVDASPSRGLFILTGSAVPPDDITRHTGAGRFLRLRQRTMTTHEKRGMHTDGVSLRDLFDGHRPPAAPAAGTSLSDVVDQILRPGFPAMTTLAPDDAATLLTSYLDDAARTDLPRLGEIRHDPVVITRVLTGIARSVASDVTYTTLASDARAVAPGIKAETVSTYVNLLRRLYLVEEQQAWTPRLRSRARWRTAPKLHLADPALAAAAIGAGRETLLRDPATLGVLFESAAHHDLTVYAAGLRGEVRHYRDSNGKEIDAVVALADGRWAAVEVKLAAAQLPAAVASLDAAVSTIDTDAVGAPAFRLVVTGTGPTLTTTDGTVTCPLHLLRP